MYRKQIWAHRKTTAQSSLETLCVLTSSLSINRSLNGCFFLPWVECTHPPTGLPLYNWHDIVIILILTGCQPFNLFTQNGIHINMCHVSMIRACYHIISTLFLDLFPSNIIDIDNFLWTSHWIFKFASPSWYFGNLFKSSQKSNINSWQNQISLTIHYHNPNCTRMSALDFLCVM